jgi:3-methylcrotonyl-CoA carboxylase alpha subunit
LKINGHAFEARIYAEDPEHDFLPATGVLGSLQGPNENSHVRIDTGVVEGDEVSIYYDPMIAKLIVWDIDRDRALQRLTDALSRYRISGLTTNIGFLYNLATSLSFQNGDVDTGYIEEHELEIFRRRDADINYAVPLAAAAIIKLRVEQGLEAARLSTEPNSPWHLNNSWGLPVPNLTIQVQQATVETMADSDVSLAGMTPVATDTGFDLFTPKGFFRCIEVAPDLGADDEDSHGSNLHAPMNGTLVALLVNIGVAVTKGDTLLVMEAMKMEHTIVAPSDGMVTEFYFQAGELVDGGSELLAFEASPQ